MSTPKQLAAFIKQQSAEIDALYKVYRERISESYLLYTGAPWTPPVRWSRPWWRARWVAVRWRIIAARRRIGLWIAGIDPSELEGE